MRKPSFVIGPDHDPYMRRWWLIPRNRFFNIYLHQVLRDDNDRGCHDHPWWNVSIILGVGYTEVCQEAALGPYEGGRWYYRVTRRERPRGSIIFRRATTAHRLECFRDKIGAPIPTWSLFITGPNVRTWGFWTEAGWTDWKTYLDPRDGAKPAGDGA